MGFLHACVLLSAAAAVPAEEIARGQTVMTRARPDFSPLGIGAGEFLVLPRLGVTAAYDDNVLATNDDEKSTLHTILRPDIQIRSGWGRHALNLTANGEVGRNATYSSEDYEDWEGALDGRFDASHALQIHGGVGGGHDHVERTAPDEENGLHPTEFDHADAFGRYSHTLGRFSLQLDTAAKRLDYGDVIGVRNGVSAVINQDDRDRTEYRFGARGGYEVWQGYETFLRVSGNRRDYDDLQDFINVDRSSDGYEATAGVTLDVGGLVVGDLQAGYMSQDYSAPFPDIQSPLFGTSLHWNPSGLTTLNLSVQRLINEAVSATYSGYTSTSMSLGVDHELRRNLLLNANFDYITDEYAGVGSASRDDATYQLQLGPTWLAGRHIHLSAHYRYLRRESDGSTATAPHSTNQFDKNILLIQLSGQL